MKPLLFKIKKGQVFAFIYIKNQDKAVFTCTGYVILSVNRISKDPKAKSLRKIYFYKIGN